MKLLREGQRIGDSYEVEKFLGEGAFAEVYRVRHRFLGRQAMKLFKMAGITLEETHAMLGEAIILSRIGHPNIVRVFNADLTETEYGRCAFFTMEYVAGGSLETFWKSFGAAFVPVETSVDILRQVCRGLSVAHGEKPPIVHRDVAPQNVLVGYDAGGLRARVSDFGLAKRVNPLTLLVSARGRRRFKAPEVFRQPDSDSCAGDVWAMGCTLYLLLTDKLPYESATDEELEDGRFSDRRLELPSEINSAVDSRLDRVVARSLALRPRDRYMNAQEMLADLDVWKPTSKDGTSGKESYSSDQRKRALGPASTPDENAAKNLVEQAIKLARVSGKLIEAADLMEESFTKSAGLRDKYEYFVKLWRQGKVG